MKYKYLIALALFALVGYSQTLVLNLTPTGKDAPAENGGRSQIKAGTLSGISKTCNTGDVYLAADQPTGHQIYSCANGSWSQTINVGASGALAFQDGVLDIVPSVVPTLQNENVFSGLNSFNLGVRLTTPLAQPDCASSLRGLFWFLNNGTAKDSVQVCVWTGAVFSWVSLY
jgi:hypothetical protein